MNIVIPMQGNDPIVEKRRCRISGKEFSITQKDIEFYKKISPKFGEYVAEIPYPTLCPQERQRRRLAFRNERKLYRRECDATQRQIISMYRPDNDYVVYDQKIWRGDSRDAMDYGREFDFTKTFTEQFGQLMQSIPRLSIGTFASENCGYTNFTMQSKDCYLAYSCVESQSVMYSRNVRRSDTIIDCLQVIDCESCYGVVIASNCFNVQSSFHVFDCSNSKYLWYCENCHFCYGCSDLKNAKYCIFNKQYTQQEYEEKVRGLADRRNDMIQIMHDQKIQYVDKNRHLINNATECGYDFVRESKDVLESYNISESVNVKRGIELERCDDCYDACFGIGNSMIYEGIGTGVHSHASLFYVTCTEMSRSMYCDTCVGGSNLFGCVGLHNKQYCIFNKQYTKQEYELLVPKIIEHMKITRERGEFFDPSLSPFGYNETVAQDYYPMNKTDIVALGYCRSDYEPPVPKSNKIKLGQELPESIEEVSDEILQYAIKCEVTDKLFRIQPKELQFYRKHSIPLPRRHPDQRHLERLEMRKGGGSV